MDDFLKIECDHGLRRRCLQFIRASFDFLFFFIAFFDVLSRNCLEIVGKSKGLRTLFKLKSYGARAVAVRSHYGFLRSPYDSRTMLGVRTILINL